MRRDRRTARLSLAAAVALVVAAVSIVVPMRSGAIMPAPGDLAAGWALLAAAVVVLVRFPLPAALLFTAGTVWVAVGLAPLAPASLETPVLRASLLPTALLAAVVVALPRATSRAHLPAASVAVSIAVIGGLGAHRFALLAIGLVVLIPGWPRHDASAAIRIAYGTGLFVVGLAGVGMLDLEPGLVASLHEVTMVVGAAGAGWVLRPGFSSTRAIELDEAAGLERALADLLASGPLMVGFPTAEGGVIDAGGRPMNAIASSRPVHVEDGSVLALVSGDWGREPDAAVRRLLAAAGRGARLRADLRDRAHDLVASRERLSTAAEQERRRLVALIAVGPLATLESIAGSLAGQEALAARVRVARADLYRVVAGLDPVADGLLPSLRRLTDASGVALTTGPALEDLDATRERAVWFTAAEGLANATRHAPGAAVRVSLEHHGNHVWLRVSDDGPGGADAAGSGLAGLAARAAAVGGAFTVFSSGHGTELRLDLPLPSEGNPQPSDVVARIPAAALGTTVVT